MADVKVSALPTDTAPEAADLIPFVDVSAVRTEAVTLANLAASVPFSPPERHLTLGMGVDLVPRSGTHPVDQHLARVRIWKPIRVSGLNVIVNTNVAAATGKLVFYEQTDASTLTLIYASPDIDCSTTGQKTITGLDFVLPGQNLWVGVLRSSTASGAAMVGSTNVWPVLRRDENNSGMFAPGFSIGSGFSPPSTLSGPWSGGQMWQGGPPYVSVVTQ